jgi:pimeloyl-ACP methyl ester carboxylesterase
MVLLTHAVLGIDEVQGEVVSQKECAGEGSRGMHIDLYAYTFSQLAKTIGQFAEQLKLNKYALMVHDYGAPVGWRLAVAHPERVTAIISQNGNAYEEGLAAGWAPIQTYWREPTQQNREALHDFPTPASIKWQYLEGVADKSSVSLDGYTLEGLQVSRPGNAEIQWGTGLEAGYSQGGYSLV